VIHHILVPTDGSENAERAVRFSAQVADRRQQAEVTVVYVHLRAPILPTIVPPVPNILETVQSTESTMALHETSEAGDHTHAQQIVRQAVQEIRRLVTAPEITVVGRIVVSEEIDKGILHMAQETQADIIVVGTRGLSTLRGAIMGSVSHALIEKAACPVLIVK
jgi:nucleotide-binding universal stress UspA family protein